MKAQELFNLRTTAQLGRFMTIRRSPEEIRELATILQNDPSLGERFIKLVVESGDPKIVGAYSPVFCALNFKMRTRLLRTFHPFVIKELWQFFGGLTAKALRYCIRAVRGLESIEDVGLCLALILMSRNPEWPSLIQEAIENKDLELVRQRMPIMDDDTEEYNSLQALVFVIGYLLSSSVMALPSRGVDPLPMYVLGDNTLTGIEKNKPLIINGAESKTTWVPWIFQKDKGMSLGLTALDELVNDLGMGQGGNDLLCRTHEDSALLVEEIVQMWAQIKEGIVRWVLPNGQMMLRFNGPLHLCGMMFAQFHPGAKVPQMTIKIVQNRFGYLSTRDYLVGEDGLFEGIDISNNLGLLELAINHRVVCWLHAFALSPKKYKGKATGDGLAPCQINPALTAEGKLPPGFHIPEYMNLPKGKNRREYAEKRCVQHGWSLPPTDRQTFRMSGDPFKDDLGFRKPLEVIYDVE